MYAENAINAAAKGVRTFCKFLAANDTGETESHQAGIYIPKTAIEILFDTPGIRGTNKERFVTIQWQNEESTESRFIYYGKGTRNEYRITRFGKGFPYLKPVYTGALFVLVQQKEEPYLGYILDSEEEINAFLDAFCISPIETNRLVNTGLMNPEVKEKALMDEFISKLEVDFPASVEMSYTARTISNSNEVNKRLALTDPDGLLISWTETEYRLFRYLEYSRYYELISKGFEDFDTFISTANQVLNRRKSRAGKSLEHHLAAIFDMNGISYSAQAVTEGNKKPDFIFPSVEAYHDADYPVGKIVLLAAKTTCKDRWRQVLNEADRLKGKRKFLCTLQQGISAAQLDEMQAEGIQLVVPKDFIKTYPKEKQGSIWSLKEFVEYVKSVEMSDIDMYAFE